MTGFLEVPDECHQQPRGSSGIYVPKRAPMRVFLATRTSFALNPPVHAVRPRQRAGGVDFCVAFGDNVEWSLACPGNGMEFDCCALLISDLAVEVVAGASGVGPAGTTPTTFERESISADVAGAALSFALTGLVLSEQPADNSAPITTDA